MLQFKSLENLSLSNSKKEPHLLQVIFAKENDAEFILGLRTNPYKNKYLNYTEPNLENQIIWLNEYKTREERGEELYYIIYENNIPVGTIRIYNINENDCTTGSWLFSSNTYQLTPIISELLIYEIVYNILKKSTVLFDVRKENKKVVTYHKLKRITLINEDEENFYYSMSRAEWEESKMKIFNLMGVKIDVDFDEYNKIRINSIW
jgi:hypothetical protein